MTKGTGQVTAGSGIIVCGGIGVFSREFYASKG